MRADGAAPRNAMGGALRGFQDLSIPVAQTCERFATMASHVERK